MRRVPFFFFSIGLAILACTSAPATLPPPPQPSAFDSGRTAFGFFPSPPEASTQSILRHFQSLGDHADFVLIQPNVPWEEVVTAASSESPRLADVRNQVTLAYQNGLDVVFVVDPLNGLNRREFLGLPAEWPASFATSEVRSAFTNFALWITREFRPRYLGLASEINTYADAHPEDFPNYLSLYREVYAAVKAESPQTQVFVTFQWEDLNNLFATAAEGRAPYQTNWDQVEAFEPELDLWVISSYPFAAFQSGAEIPADYYTPLLSRTGRPLAVAEGGYTSEPVGPFPGTPQDQVDYLNAIHSQIGGRLRFWVYLLLNDFDPESYADAMRRSGLDEEDIGTLGMFTAVGLREADGTPKPALVVWDGFRGAD
jgi:hypothetical protein